MLNEAENVAAKVTSFVLSDKELQAIDRVPVPAMVSAMRRPNSGKVLLELAMEHEESGAVRHLLDWPAYIEQLRTRRPDVDQLLLAAQTWLSIRSASWSGTQGPGAPASISDLLAKRGRDWVD